MITENKYDLRPIKYEIWSQSTVQEINSKKSLEFVLIT